MSDKDFRSDLDQWMDMWATAQGDEEFQEPRDFFPQTELESELDPDTFAYLDDMVDGTPGVLNEDKTPNPVYPDSVGKDQDKPDPKWANEKLVAQVKELKDRLFKLENELAKLGGGKKVTEKPVDMEINAKKPKTQRVQELRKQIDQLSNELGIKHEPSPWMTQKKA